MSAFPFSMQVGYDTDIGGGRENQDDFYVFTEPSLGVFVGCVFDGHGREVGKIAANAARICLSKRCEETVQELLLDPSQWIINSHNDAHYFIKDSFRKELEHQGYEVMEEERGGYLLKRKPNTQTWSCVHGGSSCSIVVIVGNDMYVGNVGDSSAILCATQSIFNHTYIRHIIDAGLSSDSALVNMRGSTLSRYQQMNESDPTTQENTLVITAEHSPESPYEFYRLREFRSRENDITQPSLLVVYDSPSQEKSRCNPIFQLDADGKAQVTNQGKYYKNVRKEWASLVSTPLTARFQDALAFTRSLGDLHLSSYGVTHLPEVHHIDLDLLFKQFTLSSPSSTSGESSKSSKSDSKPPIICLVLATDGVWDNWLYEDVTKFVLDPSCINAVNTDGNGTKRVALSFMTRNSVYAKRNFGSQADNATGIILYIGQLNQIPNGPDFIG